MPKYRQKLNFQDEISVRMKVTGDCKVYVTIMNHTTMETMVKVFSFAELLSETNTFKEVLVKDDQSETVSSDSQEVSEDDEN